MELQFANETVWSEPDRSNTEHSLRNAKLSLQIVVLVLAVLGRFTLWGAVLVDVGTALLVILHGMMLMRWRLPQDMGPGSSQNVQCSEQRWTSSTCPPLAAGREGGSSCNLPSCSTSDSCDTAAVEIEESTVVLPPKAKPSCCSADRPDSNKCAVELSDAADTPKCCASGKYCHTILADGKPSKESAAETTAHKSSCCASGKQCQPQAFAVRSGEDSH